MPIIQISKIQQRSGNLVDLPQLDNAQLGWAYDENRLFIGSAGPNVQPQNIEVLTSNSTLSFSQIDGSSNGNILIQAAQPGQILAYNTTLGAWENTGGNAVEPGNSSYYTSTANIHLGNVSNVFMGGGAIGYVLETDGFGKLSWTPKTTVVADIISLSSGTPIVMKVSTATPYYNGAEITITGVEGANANTIVNSQVFYVKVSNNFPTSGLVDLYTDPILSTAAVGADLDADDDTGTATTAVINTGITYAAGSNTSIQFNNGGVLEGSANLSIIGSNLTLTGNFTTSNVWANSGTVSASNLTGTLTTNAQPNITSIGTLINMSVSGNATIGNISTSIVSATSNVTGANLITGGLISATGNLTAGNLITSGVVSATGNANVGNIGATTAILTTGNITTVNTGLVQNGTSNVTVASGGNISLFVAGNATARILATSTGANIAGTISVSGNANVGNLGTSIVSASGNITGANIISAGTIGNTGASFLGNVLTTGANTTTGNITGNWTLTAGSRWNATYADLAEYYESDAEYEPGTVLEFGGSKEVTLATDTTTRVAGVISTNPAYVLNSTCQGEHTALIALQGRVPVKVRGNVSKGDMMVSGGEGFAKPTQDPKMGTIIGKSLENFNGIEGVIEIAVGRL